MFNQKHLCNVVRAGSLKLYTISVLQSTKTQKTKMIHFKMSLPLTLSKNALFFTTKVKVKKNMLNVKQLK